MFVKLHDPYGGILLINTDRVAKVTPNIHHDAYPEGSEYCELSVDGGMRVTVKGQLDDILDMLINRPEKPQG